MKILAAHVFYRALVTVPSLVRGWWSECKDRQLSNSVAAYTKANFSPVIIKQQLSGIRSQQVIENLQGDNFTVKVQPNVHEIVASYLVDEQQMEIALHVPSDYPLHSIEVKDVRRVGVQETKWRMWLLNINQIAQASTRDLCRLVALIFFYLDQITDIPECANSRLASLSTHYSGLSAT